MNTNPDARRILCFGDSNTWGRVPGDDNSARFAPNKRWTGILQNLLGESYEVIEEGLNGRTTSKDSPFKAGKNGATYLFSCLESQNPIDLIVLALGKNELKAQYNATPESIGDGIEECFEVIKKEGRDKNGNAPKVILVSPAIIEEKERERFGQKVVDFKGANEKSKKLGAIFQAIAEKHGAGFLNLAEIVKVSEIDGVHLDEDVHGKFAKLLYSIISNS